MANCRRLFISGIPVEASEGEIKKRFEVFGDVSSIEKVVRSHEGFPTKCFAYLDISLSDANYRKCLSLYSEAKWKGNKLIIQPAKENFLERLKTERQQKALGDDGSKLNIPTSSCLTELQVKARDGKQLMKVDLLKNSKKIKRFNSHSVMESYGGVSDLTWDLTPTTMPCDTDSSIPNNSPAKRSKKDETAKRKESNKLRLEALERSKHHSKPLIAEGSKAKSHIVFEPEDKVEEETADVAKERPLLPLFGSESEDDNDSVEVTKPKFEGKQGARLFKLQQKIGWDKRFEVDERFLNESDSLDEDTPGSSSSAEQDDKLASSDEELRREQQRNRDLIEKMFGNTSSVILPEMQMMHEVQRYDPSAVDSELLERQPPPAKKKRKEDALNKQDDKASTPSMTQQIQEVPKPVVSKERFYNVSDSLKNVLQTAESGHTFNFTTSTPRDKNSTIATTLASRKTPNWLLNLQDDDSETELDEISSTKGPPSDVQKRTLFFFHANSSELRNRLDCPDTKFHRTCSLEELEAKWPQTRARLKEQYKRRRRDALKWLRQRKQIK